MVFQEFGRWVGMPKFRSAVAGLAIAATSAVAVPATVQADAPSASIARKAPNVRCMQLDRAEAKLRRAGFRVKEHGGGIFGILNPKAWVVVHQHTRGKTVHVTAGRYC